jgi:adenylate cyclase
VIKSWARCRAWVRGRTRSLSSRLATWFRRARSGLFSKSTTKSAVYGAAGAVGFVLLFFLIHLPHGPEHWSADLQTIYLSQRLDKQHDRIALIEITDRTLARFPYVTPINRKLLADLIRTVDAAQPRAIGLDFIFDRNTEPAADQDLEAAIQKAHAPVVLGALDDDTLPGPQRSRQSDFLNRMQRPIGHLYLGDERESPLVVSEHVIRTIAEPSATQGNRLSFAEVLAGLDGPHPVDSGRQIAWLLPPKEQGGGWRSWLFADVGRTDDTFLKLPADDVLAGRDGELLRDKFVLIGGNFSDRDQHLTPLSVISDSTFSGLFIHAQILAQLLENRHLYTLQGWLPFVILMCVVVALGFWLGRLQSLEHYGLGIELVSVVVFIVISVIVFRYASFIFPFVSVTIGWLAGVSAGHYSRLAMSEATHSSIEEA